MKKLKTDLMAGVVCLLTVVLLALSVGEVDATSTGKISGIVINKKTGEGIHSVAVQIVGTEQGALTDSSGRYQILNVPVGIYSLKISLIGYKTVQVDSVVVKEGETTELNTEMQTSENDTDIVRCMESMRDIMEMKKPASGVVISREQMDVMPVKNVEDILAATVGEVRRYGEVHSKGGRSDYVLCQNNQLSGSARSPGMAHGGTTPPNSEAFDAMFFEHYGVNPFISTEDDHLSTFAVDIDDASYIMARTYLQRGELPPKDAVRVEEFVNHFDYDYATPSKERFSIYVDGSPSPFGENYSLLRIGLRGRVIPPDDRRPAVLTFVVDVSGSMGREDRLGAVRQALRMLVDQLREDDLVGIVVYGSRAWTVLDHTSIRDKETIIQAIESLVPEGSTNAEEGLGLGYKLAEKSFRQGAINRVILCSDGVANVGRTGADDILNRIEKQVKKGITLSSIGFGIGNYNDVLLEKLGNKGNGYYAYVNNMQDAHKIFVDNLTGALEVIARDVKIQVDFDPEKVERYRLLGFENRDVDDDKFRDDTVDGGEIGSGHSCTALYELKLKDGVAGSVGEIAIRFKNPYNDEVTEISREITVSDFSKSFVECDSRYRLAVVAAEFAEILRGSYWSKGSQLSHVLEITHNLSRGMTDDKDMIELLDLVSKASNLKQDEG
jgi:Ca-activated chloride channel family protein